MSGIFILAAEPVPCYSPPYPHWAFPGEVTSWLAVTGVCRRWRVIACGVSQLWRTVAVHRDVRWLKLVLPRSGSRTVDIVFHDADVIPHALKILFEHAARIRRLYFLNSIMSTYACLQHLSLVLMPHLTEIMSHYPAYTVRGLTVHGALDFRPNIFPSLHTLRCGTVQLNWEGPIVWKLTRISITDAPMLDPSFTLDRFLEVLR
ncbi:hypothetical protein C8Q74DRAFT_1212173, partial [Fomes fomentarius]